MLKKLNFHENAQKRTETHKNPQLSRTSKILQNKKKRAKTNKKRTEENRGEPQNLIFHKKCKQMQNKHAEI